MDNYNPKQPEYTGERQEKDIHKKFAEVSDTRTVTSNQIIGPNPELIKSNSLPPELIHQKLIWISSNQLLFSLSRFFIRDLPTKFLYNFSDSHTKLQTQSTNLASGGWNLLT